MENSPTPSESEDLLECDGSDIETFDGLHAPPEGTASSPLDLIAAENPGINRVEVLHNRVVPGSDCGLEHVIVANHAVIVIRATPKKGRVRITKDTIYVGGANLQIMLLGLKSRLDTARHMVGGEAPVFGAIFLSKQPDAELKHFGSIPIGSSAAVVQHITEEHCKSEINPNLAAMAYELDGIFLSAETFEQREDPQQAAA